MKWHGGWNMEPNLFADNLKTLIFADNQTDLKAVISQHQRIILSYF